tara:strand:- start:3409 stop:4449 length:1041 start_codon:yes stop_codon:yes gene_type:complete
MRLSQLIESLKCQGINVKSVNNLNDPDIHEGASIFNASKNQISFIENGHKIKPQLSSLNPEAIILPDDKTIINSAKINKKNFIVVENSKLAFAIALSILNPRERPKACIHKSAVIEESAIIAKDVYIGANVYIGSNTKIETNSIIHPGVIIYDNVVIEKYCELHANCVIHTGTHISQNCIINSNAVIGSEGFGFIPTEEGWVKMPQTGIVYLENDVEIGCCSNVDRPAVGETRIGRGTKIDNLVQIGHGVKIGKDCAMASQVGIAGGAKIGNGVILAGQVGVSNRVEVGDNVIASSKCGIHSDMDSNQVISGFPAISNRLWLKCSANFKKLPEMAKTLKALKADRE